MIKPPCSPERRREHEGELLARDLAVGSARRTWSQPLLLGLRACLPIEVAKIVRLARSTYQPSPRWRQGDLRGKAHLEPPLSPGCKEGPPIFAARPRKMAGLVPTLANDAPMQICRTECPVSPRPCPGRSRGAGLPSSCPDCGRAALPSASLDPTASPERPGQDTGMVPGRSAPC
jgi:hypothetical protein